MSEFLKIIIQALIQGLTEFLPVSSSGHMVLAGHILGIRENLLFLGAMLHLGTLFSVIIYYWKDIWKLIKGVFSLKADELLYTGKIMLTTAVTALVVFIVRDPIEAHYEDVIMTAVMWVITAAVLFVSDFSREGNRGVTWTHAAVIGLVQSIAVLPGISRSGATLAAAILLGMARKDALRYVFLISIPVIAGGALVSASEMTTGNTPWLWIITGAVTAFIVGYISIKVLVAVTSRGKLKYFSYYLFILAFLTLIFYI